MLREITFPLSEDRFYNPYNQLDAQCWIADTCSATTVTDKVIKVFEEPTPHTRLHFSPHLQPAQLRKLM